MFDYIRLVKVRNLADTVFYFKFRTTCKTLSAAASSYTHIKQHNTHTHGGPVIFSQRLLGDVGRGGGGDGHSTAVGFPVYKYIYTNSF